MWTPVVGRGDGSISSSRPRVPRGSRRQPSRRASRADAGEELVEPARRTSSTVIHSSRGVLPNSSSCSRYRRRARRTDPRGRRRGGPRVSRRVRRSRRPARRRGSRPTGGHGGLRPPPRRHRGSPGAVRPAAGPQSPERRSQRVDRRAGDEDVPLGCVVLACPAAGPGMTARPGQVAARPSRSTTPSWRSSRSSSAPVSCSMTSSAESPSRSSASPSGPSAGSRRTGWRWPRHAARPTARRSRRRGIRLVASPTDRPRGRTRRWSTWLRVTHREVGKIQLDQLRVGDEHGGHLGPGHARATASALAARTTTGVPPHAPLERLDVLDRVDDEGTLDIEGALQSDSRDGRPCAPNQRSRISG